jgi:hypothetical protein
MANYSFGTVFSRRRAEVPVNDRGDTTDTASQRNGSAGNDSTGYFTSMAANLSRGGGWGE